MKVDGNHVGGLLQFGIKANMDPMEGLEEGIVRAILVAFREGQGIAQLGFLGRLLQTPTSSKGNSFN